MDAVKAFNNELSALYEVKPPISKAKMSSITRSAIKAIKFYKHVVQSVEKFIQKCKPEYKVPGLYVIDSIVRQSRHQFGPDKDVFAPRFSKNMQNTFANLFSCPPEDKGKIIRVLNLWQKNSVFTPDVIQPLFDQLADPSNPIHRDNINSSNGLVVSGDHTSPSSVSKSSTLKKSGLSSGSDGNTPHWVKLAQLQIDAANKAIFELTGSNVAQSKSSSNSNLDILHQIQQLQQFLVSQTNQSNQSNQKQERSQSDQVVFDKKLLDFDYDDDEENTSPHHQSNNDNFNYMLQNPEILKPLTTLQQQMSQYQFLLQQVEAEEKMRKLKEMKRQEEEFDKHLAQTVPKLPFASECDLKQYQDSSGSNSLPDLSVPPPGYSKQGYRTDTHDPEVEFIEDKSSERDRKVEVINLLERSPSSSPSQTSNRRRHSRSRSRDRRRSRRSRSRSSRSRSRSLRPKRKRRSRSRSRDPYLESEKERERRKKGLPPIKKNHLSVCSTTLWVGHLSKLVQPEELSDTFGECGDVVSIDVIPPRGCAFICMNRRQDAARALVKLKDHKLQGKSIMLAWAPGKGVKDRNYKDYWEIELGVSYIPWSRLNKDTDFAALEEGGAIDEDTMPEDLKETILEQLQKKKNEVDAENKLKTMAAPGFIPLPEGISVPSVPPVLAATLPAVMTVPPPVIGASNSPAAPTIDTSQPPPNMSPGSNGGVPVPVALPRIPVLAKPGIMMPPFPFTSLPPPLGIGVPNMMSNLPISVPPPPPGLLMQQQLMAIPTSGASPFPTGTIMPPISVAGGSSDKMESTYDHHPLQGQPLGMSNHKTEEAIDREAEGDDKSKAKARSPRDRDKFSSDRSRDDGRRRDDDRRDDRDRDKDKGDRDRDRRKDRDRRRRRSRERERSRGHERDFRNRSRESDRRRDRDRSRGKSRERDRSSDEGKGKRDDSKKEPVNQWVEVPLSTEEKPSLLQRLRNIAEGGGDPSQMGQMFGGPPARMPEPGNRHGLPIVINFNNSGMQRPGFVPRGPMMDVFRPEFGPRGPIDFGPRGGFGDGMPSNDSYNPRGRGPMDQNDRSRGRFDMSAPRPLMETHFEGHPLIPDDMRGPMMHDGMRGPMMHPDDMMHPDEMRNSMYDDPRMRFGPRGMMGPMPRGPIGPHGPGLVPLYGPRGPRPSHGRLNIWMDNQGPPPLGDNYIRAPFDRRGLGPGGPGPRFRPDRLRDRQARVSKDDAKDGARNEPGKKYEGEDKNENEDSVRDTQTPCHDEKAIDVQDDSKQIHNEPIEDTQRTEQSEPPEEYERDTGTPCHDEPEVPNIVVQAPKHRFTQILRLVKMEPNIPGDEEAQRDVSDPVEQEVPEPVVPDANEDSQKQENAEA